MKTTEGNIGRKYDKGSSFCLNFFWNLIFFSCQDNHEVNIKSKDGFGVFIIQILAGIIYNHIQFPGQLSHCRDIAPTIENYNDPLQHIYCHLYKEHPLVAVVGAHASSTRPSRLSLQFLAGGKEELK